MNKSVKQVKGIRALSRLRIATHWKSLFHTKLPMNTKCHFIDKNLHYDCEFRAQFYQGVKHFFVLSLLKYATKDSTLAEGVDTSQAPDKDLLEKEKATLKKLLPLVEKFVHEKSVLQVSWFVSELVPLLPPFGTRLFRLFTR